MFFAKIVNGWEKLTIFPKSSILDVWLGSEYVSGKVYNVQFVIILHMLIKWQPYKFKLSIPFHWQTQSKSGGYVYFSE